MVRKERTVESELIPSELREGWTKDLLRAAIEIGARTANAVAADTKEVDYDIRIAGFGQAIANCNVQRLIYGWAMFGARLGIPALVRVDLSTNNDMPMANAVSQPAKPAARRELGHLSFDGRFRSDGEKRYLVPVLLVRLQLPNSEWTPLCECLSLGASARGRGPKLTIRAQYPASLSAASLVEKPHDRSFPVIRFWSEIVVTFDESLNAHPVFSSSMESGTIEQLF